MGNLIQAFGVDNSSFIANNLFPGAVRSDSEIWKAEANYQGGHMNPLYMVFRVRLNKIPPVTCEEAIQ